MNIEISGVFPANRGALLMLEAIREQISQAFPEARIAVPLDWAGAERLRHRVWGTPGSLPKDLSLRVLERAPWQLRDRAAFVRSSEIDVMLDASGFGYGDFWGLDKLRRRLTDRLANWKTQGKKAILLPQALGPFEDPGMADAFRSAAQRLDRVYVRDATSMAYVETLLPGHSRVRRAPDFTNLLKPDLPSRLDALRGAAFVIPNEKMVSGKGDAVYSRYLGFLADSVTAIRATGREATVLLHEGHSDKAIAAALNDQLDTPAPVVDEPDALVTKALIGSAEFIVSSRFHGLVSALSAGVPALACGWSHKYRELMKDYGCAESIIHFEDGSEPRPEIDAFLERVKDPAYRGQITQHAQREKAKSQAMWDDALEVIRS